MAVEIVTYQERPVHVSEFITPPWRDLCRRLGSKLGQEIVVPPFPDREGLASRLKEGYKPIYVPRVFSGVDSIPQLEGAVVDLLASFGLTDRKKYISGREPQLLKNRVNHSEWRYITATPRALYMGTNEAVARRIIKKKKGEGITLNEELILVYYNLSLVRDFVDKGTWTRVLGTSANGKDLNVSFYSSGDAHYCTGWRTQKSPYVGIRWSLPCPQS